MSASRKLRRRKDRDRIVVLIPLPLSEDIQPWEYELLAPHLQAMLEAVLKEPQAPDDDEQGQT